MKPHRRQQDIAAHQFQKTGGQYLADKLQCGEEQEDALAEGDDLALTEDRPGQPLAAGSQRVGQKRQQQRQEQQRKTPESGDDMGRFRLRGKSSIQTGAETARQQTGDDVGRDEEAELRQGGG